MLGLKAVHHIAIIATDYAKSKAFYCDILGFTLLSEAYREERDSWKGDLALNGQYVIELFSFPFPPARPSRPEACGLRVNRSVSIPSPTSVLPFLTTRMICRWSFTSSNVCPV